MLVPVDDAALLRRQRQFLEEVERKIAEANREILHERIPELNKDSFVDLAKHVARLRATYLQVALEGKEGEDANEFVQELRRRREAYDEARDAFEALQRAIQRGYVDIGEAAHAG